MDRNIFMFHTLPFGKSKLKHLMQIPSVLVTSVWNQVISWGYRSFSGVSPERAIISFHEVLIGFGLTFNTLTLTYEVNQLESCHSPDAHHSQSRSFHADSLQRQQVTYMRASSVADDFFASHIAYLFLLEWYFGCCKSLILQYGGDFWWISH